MDLRKTSGVLRTSGKLSWTDDFIQGRVAAILHDVVKEQQSPCGTIYLDARSLGFSPAGQQLPEVLRDFLRTHCIRVASHVGLRLADIDGFELWTNFESKSDSPSTYFHVDNDEEQRRETSEVVCPLLGAVLYLGTQRVSRASGTFFLNSATVPNELRGFLFRKSDWAELEPHLRVHGQAVSFVPGRLVVFDGSLPHAAIPQPRDAAVRTNRTALLMNIWQRRPALREESRAI